MKDEIAQLTAELNERNCEVYKLRQENESLKANSFGYRKVRLLNDFKFFTGLDNLHLFLWVVSLVKGVKTCLKSLSTEDHVLMVLMKLRLGLLNKNIAYRYGLQPTMVSKIYRQWLPEISKAMQSLIVWPSRPELRMNLPTSFRRKYSDCVCIIDCYEIFVERPKNLTARAQTWSNYKHNNTTKYLVAISPAGAVIFLSTGWGGRVSDKEITLQSGFLDKISYGDCVLADRGFLIENELNSRGSFLKIPKFTKGKEQLPAKDVHDSRRLSNVRNHVERVIGQLKNFRILQNTIPLTQIDLLDDAMVVIAAAVNLNKSVVT